MMQNTDVDSLSEHIVENLDEISALREQAEVEMPVDQCREWLNENCEEDEHLDFDSVDEVTGWYHMVR